MKNLTIAERIKAKAARERGKKFRDDGEYEKAIKKFSEAINIDPSNAFAYGGRGYTYALNGQDDLAIEDYTKSIKLLENDIAWLYERRGLCYECKDQYDLAIESYNEAVRIAPNEPLNYFSRGCAYEQKGQYELAIENYTELIINNRDTFPKAFPCQLRAYAYSNNGQYELAINDYSEAIKLEPNNADIYAWRGSVYIKLGDKEAAKKDFDKAFSLDPENEFAKEFSKKLN